MALKDRRPVGTVRLTLGHEKNYFPTFRMWNIDVDQVTFNFSKIAEISKLGIGKFENMKILIWLPMMKKVLQKSKQLGVNVWIFKTSNRVVHSIQHKFHTPVHTLPQRKDIQQNLDERETIKGLTRKYKMNPYYLDLNEIGDVTLTNCG